jgi:DNA-binding transcriptional MerR regulator
MSAASTYTIRQMIELTGLSEFTIRGWENRYRAFQPKRGETGRRVYSKSDVERALLLRELIQRGWKIGALAKLSNAKLTHLFTDAETASGLALDVPPLVTEAMEYLALQKWEELELCLKKVASKNARSLVLDFFLPAIFALTTSVQNGRISISQEHIFSSFLKEKIFACLHQLPTTERNSNPGSRRFILAGPEGDYHEIGILLAHLLVRSSGHTSLYLGPHTPAPDLAETALRFRASDIFIVSTVSPRNGAKLETLTYVHEVQKRVGPEVHILLAGAAAPKAQSPKPSFTILPNFHALIENLIIKEKNR